MKRLLLIVLCLLVFPWTPCQSAEPIQLARMSPWVAGSVATIKSCPSSEESLLDLSSYEYDFYSVATTSSLIYLGQGGFDPSDIGGTSRICSVSASVRNVVGSGATIQVEIYEISGASLGSSPTGTCVSESQAISTTGIKKFTGLNCLLESGKTYGITFTRSDHSYSTENSIYIFLADPGLMSGGFWSWDAAKARTDDHSSEIAMKLWGYNE